MDMNMNARVGTQKDTIQWWEYFMGWAADIADMQRITSELEIFDYFEKSKEWKDRYFN